MPKLRRLSGKEVVRIFEGFGFVVFSQRGSHIRMQRITNDDIEQRLLVAVHGSKAIPIGTLKSIYRKACEFISEDDLKHHFYTD